MNTKVYLLMTTVLGALACAVPAYATEFSCNQDPVYEKNFNAKPTVALRLRSIPCMDESEILTVMPKGSVVAVTAETDGWYKVKYAGQVGWAGSQLMEKTEVEVANKTVTVKPSDKPANVKMVGISEYNFKLLQNGDKRLVDRLKGKTVLRVEKRGEAYYVFANGSLRYLKSLEELKLLSPNGQMPELKLSAQVHGADVKLAWKAVNAGATEGFKVVMSDSANPSYPGNEYKYLSDTKTADYVWPGFKPGQTVHFRVCAYAEGVCKFYSNDVAISIAPEAQDQEVSSTVSQDGTLVLRAILSDPGKVKLDWDISGLDTSKGFKVVMSESVNPVYPGNTYHYLTSPAARQDYWSGLGNKTYHFRVCQYLGGACGKYSNDVAVSVTTNGAASEGAMPGEIVLTGAAAGNGAVSLSWAVTDTDVSKGFKIVNSTESNPVYPGNDYHYLSDASARSDVWSGFTVGKTYHFRVCQYLGGYCGLYSNDLAITIK